MATNYLKKVGLNKDGKVINYLFATGYTDCLKLAYDKRRYFILTEKPPKDEKKEW